MNDLRKQLMEIWKTCFGDSDEFIRFYFHAKYRENQVVFKEENGKIVSALHLIPYTMTWQNTEIPVSYLAGACTLPEMRKQGLMKDLLISSFRRLQEMHIPVSVLIPAEKWLFNYYGRSGYAPVFNYTPAVFPETIGEESLSEIPVYEIPSRQIFKKEIPAGFPSIEKIYRYFNRKMHERPCCIQHTYADFETNLTELYVAGGKIYISISPEYTINGLAWVLRESSRIFIKEIVSDKPSVTTALIREIKKTGQPEEIACKCYPPVSPVCQYGMARIINALQMLEIFAVNRPDLALTLKLADPELPENNGWYRIKNGKCEKSRTRTPEPFCQLDIRQLTYALFGCQPCEPEFPENIFPLQYPWMNLMLD